MRKRRDERRTILDAVDTTPVTRSKMGPSIPRAIAGVLAIPLIVIAIMGWWGLPALRWEYSYSGPPEHRQYYWCAYLTVEGFRKITPGPGINQCSLIMFTPVNVLNLIGVQRWNAHSPT